MNAKVPFPVDTMCYSEEVLIDYHLGDRSQEEREAIRTHVQECGRCAAMLLDISEFFRPAEQGGQRPSRNIRQDWRLYQDRVEWNDQPNPWVQPVSFLLGAILAAFGLWMWSKPAPGVSELLNAQQRLERRTLELKSQMERQDELLKQFGSPRTDVVVAELNPGGTRVEARPGGLVAIVVPGIQDAASAEIRQGDGSVIWRLSPVSGKLTVAIPRSMLPDGRYDLFLEDGRRTQRYPLQVVSTP